MWIDSTGQLLLWERCCNREVEDLVVLRPVNAQPDDHFGVVKLSYLDGMTKCYRFVGHSACRDADPYLRHQDFASWVSIEALLDQVESTFDRRPISDNYSLGNVTLISSREVYELNTDLPRQNLGNIYFPGFVSMVVCQVLPLASPFPT
jgi:hypothetical protein